MRKEGGTHQVHAEKDEYPEGGPIGGDLTQDGDGVIGQAEALLTGGVGRRCGLWCVERQAGVGETDKTTAEEPPVTLRTRLTEEA